ncbi:MAG: hypothetical protein ACTSP4_00800 [Candidatus Hodarchaeales archaeon]
MKAPKRVYKYNKKDFITLKIIKENIIPNLSLVNSIDGINIYEDIIKKKYLIGMYQIDSFLWAFEVRRLQLTPIDDELPYKRWGWI